MALCAGLCLIGATAPAAAEPVRSQTVAVADLNRATPQGRAAFAHRLTAAAHRVCTSAETGPAAQVEEHRCVTRALATAKSVIG